MITYYPYFQHAIEEFRHMGGGQSGILQGIIAPMVKIPPEPYLRSMTGSMPNYHKLTFNDPTKDVQYHIAGYGIYNEEAIIRFMGESVERYAPIVTESLFKAKAVYASYKEMQKKGLVLPLEYINIFSAEQQVRMHQMMPSYSERHITEDDVISWISCPSLIYPGKNVWVPLQLMFVGYVKNESKKEMWVTPSFSTGTAAHRTIQKALLNAIVEYIQIDAFVLSWYTERKSIRIQIDDPIILNILEKVGLGENSPYEIVPLYITLPDLYLPSVMVILRRKDKKIPAFILGVQGDMNIRNAVLRGIFEATAIISMNVYNTIYDPKKVIFANTESAFADLDTNVLYYGTPIHDDVIDGILHKMTGKTVPLSFFESSSKSTTLQLSHLLNELKKISEFAVYLDLTPPELYGKNWNVMRTFIPELCGMCFPGFPFKEHPRMKQYGGVLNGYPHPLP